MKQLKKVMLLACILILILSCAHQTKNRKMIQDIPVFHLRNYPGFNPHSSLADRIIPAPEFILEYLNTMDKTKIYTQYYPLDTEMKMITEYLDLLPREYKYILQKRLVGIYFIRNFIGSGMADFILDENDTIYCNLYINPETMKKDITTWMSFRENTCFVNSRHMRVVQECGTTYTGLFYLLLHETSHIMDYVCSVTPYVDDFLGEILEQKGGPTDFSKGIWKYYDVPVKEHDFDQRHEITFYGFNNGPKVTIQDAETLYSRLVHTPFTSLYGSQSWAEDWAEYATWYYFTEVYHQPYILQLYKDDILVNAFEPMRSKKVKERLPVVKKILAALPDKI